MIKNIITHNEQETIAIARDFVVKLTYAPTVAFIGELGAGKTFFTRAIARTLGIKANITSPTFNILKNYLVKNNDIISSLCHIDAYRLTNPQELIDLDINEYLNDPHIFTVIEWADKVKEVLPPNTIFIKLAIIDDNKRQIYFSNNKK